MSPLNLPRLATFAVCFTVIHQGTKPDHQLMTLAAIVVVIATIVAWEVNW